MQGQQQVSSYALKSQWPKARLRGVRMLPRQQQAAASSKLILPLCPLAPAAWLYVGVRPACLHSSSTCRRLQRLDWLRILCWLDFSIYSTARFTLTLTLTVTPAVTHNLTHNLAHCQSHLQHVDWPCLCHSALPRLCCFCPGKQK
jgi:hypothetical protein